MPVDFTGKWELESSENLENYLKALDIDFAIRKIAAHLTPIKTFVQDGDNFVIKTQSAFKSYELSFAVGVEKEEFTKGFDNRMLKVNYTYQGFKGWKHWIEDDKLYLELTCEDAVCQQVYKRKD
ncbi:retinol-binding protein 2b [Sinocyclocheilus rhinocerous]|uniref:retinol-binding protein 2b n=1 Tax=Sinocyclocheilus rhinocerous TaxID=307959 RepID=UPI0007B8C3F4|nr:PREDICTED: retinol-binding protein 2-like [Sinocyclocheilus rhinocerous]